MSETSKAGTMIEVKGLTKRYGDFTAVQDLSFAVKQGEVVGFLGPNGAGKTTTMRVLTGYMPPGGGSVSVAGHDLARAPLAARRAVGYLPETPPLYPEMRVERYVRHVAALYDVPGRQRGAKVAAALAACGLEDVAERQIQTLSKGYRQRVGLAQAIVHEPEVLILDEPTSGLDPVQIAEIRGLIRTLAEEQGRTVVLSTHVLGEVEAICQRVLLIAYGRLRLDERLAVVQERGSLEQVFLEHVEAASAEYRSRQAGSGPPEPPASEAQAEPATDAATERP